MPIQPKLRFPDLTMIVVSLVIGVGIFRTPASVAQDAGTVSIFYLAWILGGLVSLCGAFTFAEIGARLPAAGGYYKIFSAVYHPAVAFMFNWSLVIINAGSAAGVAIIGAEYAFPVLFPQLQNDTYAIRLFAIALLLLLYGINYAGIRMGARMQNVLSGLKIFLILLFCSAVFFQPATPEGGEVTTITPIHSSFLFALGACFISIFFTFGGYQQTVNFGADIDRPQRNIPKAILTGMAIVTGLYVLLNITYVRVLGLQGVASSPLVASSVAGALFGSTGSKIAGLFLSLSAIGFLNTSVMSNPRVYYAMAEDNMLPAIFKRVNSKTQIQEFGLSFFVALMIASVFLLGSFDKIVVYVISVDSVSLAVAAAAIFLLRKRSGDAYTGFQLGMVWKNIVPGIFIITLLFASASTISKDHTAAIIGFLVLLAGWPLYYLIRSFKL